MNKKNEIIDILNSDSFIQSNEPIAEKCKLLKGVHNQPELVVSILNHDNEDLIPIFKRLFDELRTPFFLCQIFITYLSHLCERYFTMINEDEKKSSKYVIDELREFMEGLYIQRVFINTNTCEKMCYSLLYGDRFIEVVYMLRGVNLLHAFQVFNILPYLSPTTERGADKELYIIKTLFEQRSIEVFTEKSVDHKTMTEILELYDLITYEFMNRFPWIEPDHKAVAKMKVDLQYFIKLYMYSLQEPIDLLSLLNSYYIKNRKEMLMLFREVVDDEIGLIGSIDMKDDYYDNIRIASELQSLINIAKLTPLDDPGILLSYNSLIQNLNSLLRCIFKLGMNAEEFCRSPNQIFHLIEFIVGNEKLLNLELLAKFGVEKSDNIFLFLQIHFPMIFELIIRYRNQLEGFSMFSEVLDQLAKLIMFHKDSITKGDLKPFDVVFRCFNHIADTVKGNEQNLELLSFEIQCAVKSNNINTINDTNFLTKLLNLFIPVIAPSVEIKQSYTNLELTHIHNRTPMFYRMDLEKELNPDVGDIDLLFKSDIDTSIGEYICEELCKLESMNPTYTLSMKVNNNIDNENTGTHFLDFDLGDYADLINNDEGTDDELTLIQYDILSCIRLYKDGHSLRGTKLDHMSLALERIYNLLYRDL